MGGIEWREMVDIELGVLGYDEEMWYHQAHYHQRDMGADARLRYGECGDLCDLGSKSREA